MAVVLTLEQTKQIRMNVHKRNNKKNTVQRIQNSKYKYTYYQKTHTYTHIHITKQFKQPQEKIHTKCYSHITIKYPQYKVIVMYVAILSSRTSCAQ